MTGEEDEGFQDDWLSNLYGRGHRASTGSTMSSHSTGKRRREEREGGRGERRRKGREGGRGEGGEGEGTRGNVPKLLTEEKREGQQHKIDYHIAGNF